VAGWLCTAVTVPRERRHVDYLACKSAVAFTQEEVKAAEQAPATVARVVVETEREPQTVGELIRFWRTHRRLSQLELALEANLSTKHLSFVERLSLIGRGARICCLSRHELSPQLSSQRG
jgi:hypothetical protein